MISQTLKQRIVDAADIVEIVRSYGVELHRKGADYVALCPFHSEKTPSFHVSPTRGTWHCFGACQEGGDVISFVMKHENMGFIEALKVLASKTGIEWEEEPESEQERERRLHRDALLALNRKVADYYAAELLKAENAFAMKYLTDRFGKEFTLVAGLGYAPGANTLEKWAKENGEDTNMLMELGLLLKSEKTGQLYDAYRQRAVFPIRDRLSNVVGFTCRDLSGTAEAKYRNSSTSEVFHKDTVLFGIDTAAREMRRQNLAYIVEGAPDVLRMQSVGICNVAAPMGTAFTENQMKLLKGLVSHICFINDADPVPPGRAYGTGIEKVMKNGEKALEMGFTVSVREIPNREGNGKQDPADFFTDRHRLSLLPEEDFILWTASKICVEGENSTKQTENFKHLAKMASLVEDEMRQQLIINGLQKFYRSRTFWTSAIRKAAAERKQGDDMRSYGFTVRGNCYFGRTDKSEMRWSNFIMKPVYLVLDSENPRRLYDLVNEYGRRQYVEFSPSEMVSISNFKRKTEFLGNFHWEVTSAEFERLKSYLFRDTPEAQLIRQMGWHTGGYFAFGNGILMDGKFHKPDDFGVCHLDEKRQCYIPSASKIFSAEDISYERERRFILVERDKQATLSWIFSEFAAVFGTQGKIGLCFYLMTLFRDVVVANSRVFPFLCLFGPKGTGKSEMGRALVSFFCMEPSAPNIRTASIAAISNDIGFSSNALVMFDEYKNDIDMNRVEIIKSTYDNVGRSKMGGADFQKRVMTRALCGIILCGQEMPTIDPAMFQRSIFVEFTRSDYSEKEMKRLNDLYNKHCKKGLTYLTAEILSHRKLVESRFAESFEAVEKDLGEMTRENRLESRIFENWCRLLSVMHTLRDTLPFPFTYEEMLSIVAQKASEQNGQSKTGNEVGTFWEIFSCLYADGKIYEDCDFIIKAQSKIKVKRENVTADRNFENVRKLIKIKPDKIFIKYTEACRQGGIKPLDTKSLKNYLRRSEEYVGEENSVAFRHIIDGYVQQRMNEETGKMENIRLVRRAMVFDYDHICSRYDLELISEDARK